MSTFLEQTEYIDEKELLIKGLNFVPTPTSVPISSIVEKSLVKLLMKHHMRENRFLTFLQSPDHLCLIYFQD